MYSGVYYFAITCIRNLFKKGFTLSVVCLTCVQLTKLSKIVYFQHGIARVTFLVIIFSNDWHVSSASSKTEIKWYLKTFKRHYYHQPSYVVLPKEIQLHQRQPYILGFTDSRTKTRQNNYKQMVCFSKLDNYPLPF